MQQEQLQWEGSGCERLQVAAAGLTDPLPVLLRWPQQQEVAEQEGAAAAAAA